ncbi:hypothetical protein VB620_03215 [Nodularia harveyana UHCC-0300]|uniref:Transmembrane protein n=1 Tax=Nodularia harveyana UHCC-0300 TaxID=2974287 RepID=A0ABU5UAD3_9CYAN|nr:hypothetical protein [Nodularia harveyana]MEA5580348.1 hypothetical protein [Nodularia harveyana UHCC-0300]
MLLGTTAVALYSLSYAGSAEDNIEPETIAAVVETPMKITSEDRNPTPLWLVFAIALSCAGGCSMIFRLINHNSQPQKARQPIKIHSARPSTVNPRRRRREPRALKNPPVFVPLQPPNHIIPRRAKSQSSVRVRSLENRHRLEKRKETLVELMDIRQQNSLPKISHQNF